jgi:DNA (cytosine-5)-methyltransferase 3A
MKILSLFDGISCGLEALKQLGLPVSEYHSYEIDKHAIAVSESRHPEIIRHGSVVGADFSRFEGVDLLLAGSPCVAFSAAGRKKGFGDPRGQLFFDMIRALEQAKPKYFLFENVRMKKEHEDVMTSHIGVKPILINSALSSAQNRHRLYWTNIVSPCGGGVGQPPDRGIMLKDILLDNGNFVSDEIELDYVNHEKLLQLMEIEVARGKVVKLNDKYILNGVNVLEGGEIYAFLRADRGAVRQNGRRFNNDGKAYTLTTIDRHGVLRLGRLRKLHPIECERLMNLPDNYTSAASTNQRYKMLGNGWEIGTIKHILAPLLHK